MQKYFPLSYVSPISFYIYLVLTVNTIYFLTRCYVKTPFTSLDVFLSFFCLLFYSCCFSLIRYISGAGSGALVEPRAGPDSHECVLAFNLRNLILITALAQLLSLVSGWMWSILLLGPAHIYYKHKKNAQIEE